MTRKNFARIARALVEQKTRKIDSPKAKSPKTRTLRLESLEERQLLSATPEGLAPVASALIAEEAPLVAEGTQCVVSSLTDSLDDPGSLRALLASAQDGDSIVFDASLKGGTITLGGSELVVDKAITIDASAIWDDANDAPGIAISGNDASRVFNVTANVSFVGLTITRGYSRDNGGGVYATKSLSLVDCVISENAAANQGGGVYLSGYSGSYSFDHCVVKGNVAASGAGFYAYQKNGSLTGCSLVSNDASSYGGGALVNFASVSLSNSVVAANKANSYAGGIYAGYGTLTLSNATISGNSAKYAGGLWSSQNTILENSIVALNYGEWKSYEDVYRFYVESSTNSLIGLDPEFVEAPVFDSNGTLTNPDTLDLRLAPGSRAIDRGDNSLVTDSLDIDGNSRIVASWKSSSTVDIGAYEYQGTFENTPETPSLVVTSELDIVDDSDNLISLREAILYAKAGDTISFAPILKGKTIVLNGSALEVDKNVTIDASDLWDAENSKPGVTISGNNASRVFSIYSGAFLIALDVANGVSVDGGGINSIGNLVVSRCVIRDNVATNCGAGIFQYDGVISVDNTLIYGNSVSVYNFSCCSGGGVYINYGSGSLTNCTIAGNYAKNYGGGVATYCSVAFYNTIVAQNAAPYDAEITGRGYAAYCCAIGGAPGFVSGPTLSAAGVLTNESELDLRLLQTSWAIDRGDNSRAAEIDFAGNQRTNAGWKQTPTVDIGAFEYRTSFARTPEEPSLVVTTYEDVVDDTDGKISLREAIAYANDGETVSFDEALRGAMIVLNGVDLCIDKAITIDGADLGITISGGGASRVFTVAAKSNFTKIIGFRIVDGKAEYGSGLCVYLTTTDYAVNVENCLFTGGFAYEGGGVFIYGGTANLYNCSVAGNFASYGRGVYLKYGEINLYNSILATNSENGTNEINDYGVRNARNVLSPYSVWTNASDPNVVNYVYDMTLPLFADPENGDYSLAENSQAIDLGDNQYVSAEFDLAGNPRIANGIVDLGAYEFVDAAPSLLTVPTLALTFAAENSLTVEIGEVENATSYVLEYGTDSNYESCKTLNVLASGELVLEGLSPETTYYLRVKATDGETESDWSRLTAETGSESSPYDLGDLAVVESLGLTAESDGVVWNDQGRLVELTCSQTTATSVDLTDCDALTKFVCNGTSSAHLPLCELNASGLLNLQTINVNYCSLISLDLSGCANLQTLDCYGNQLTSLDLIGLSSLQSLLCGANQLTELNVVGFASLQYLYCYHNQLTELDLTNCANLLVLDCYSNELTSLDLTGCADLYYLWCDSNELTSLDLTDCANLQTLRYSYNKLTNLDLGSFANLKFLDCGSNGLTSLDPTNFPNLQTLWCYSNELTSLDLTGCANLQYLWCDYNELTSLDLSGCTNLQTLRCWDNELTSLDLTDCANLQTLWCDGNELTSLDLSGCANLQSLRCSSNQLTSLDLTGSANLKTLWCESNQLTSLVISDSPTLNSLRFDSNIKRIATNPSDSIELNIAYSTAWNDIQVVDGSGTQIQHRYRSITLPPDSVAPITISYLMNGEIVGTTTINGSSQTEILEAPTLALTFAAENSLTVEIGEVENATSYVLEYGTDSNYENCETLNVLASGELVLEGLSPETTYNLRVKATDGETESDWSQLTATTARAPLAAPTLTLSQITDTSFVATIGPVAGANRYVLEYATNPVFQGYQLIYCDDPGDRTISGLTIDATYYVRVKTAAEGFYDSDWTTASAKTDLGSLVTPSVSNVAVKGTSITAKLAASTNARQYLVEYGTDETFATVETATYTAAGTMTFSSLLSGSTYYFRVKAVADHYYDSDWTTFQAQTAPRDTDLCVTSVTAPATAVSGSLIELVWNEKNAGPRTVSEVRRDAIYISTDGTLENAELIKTVRYTDALAPNESIQRRQTITVPSTGYTGNVKFVVVADYDNTVLESDETNNSRATSTATALTQTLNVSLSASSLDEGTQNVRGTVSRAGDLSQPLVVSIASNDPTELTVAESVTIPAGQASAPFFYSAVKDDECDSDVYVELAFSATGFDTKYASVKVVNIDYPQLSLSVSKYSLNEGEEFILTVTRSCVTDKPITVRLTASSSSQLNLPSSVVIPANESAAAVTVSVVDDDRPESVEEVKIAATSPTFTSASKTISILDDDEPTIAISLDVDAVGEGVGGGAFVGTVTRTESASSALRVRLTSSNPSKIGVPNEVTIPAGRTSVKFYGASYDNGIVDGDVLVTITATGVQENCGCSMSSDSTGTAATQILVADDDGAALTVRLSKALLSQGEENASTVTVSRNTAATDDLVVSLVSSDPILIVPETITIPAGSASATATIATGLGESFAMEIWTTITATAPGFSQGTAKALVSDALWPDLRPSNVQSIQSETDLSSFEVSYYVVNEGRAETRSSWKEQVWVSTKPTLDDDAQLVATFERNDAISNADGNNSVYRSFSCSPLDMGDSVYWIVVVDSDETITELCETNNLATSGEQNYVPPYAAVVQTDVEKADPSTPIPLYGYAYDVNTGARVGGVDVTIDISNGSVLRTLTVTTASDGSFETTWIPLSTEVGSYSVGARRPGKTTAPVQDRFSLMKLSLDATKATINISTGQTVVGSFVIRNKTAEPITNLDALVEGLADNVRLAVNFSSTIIPAGGSATVTLTATALSADAPASTAKLRVTSEETRDEEIALAFNVYPSHAVLTTDKPILSTSMTVGAQKIVEFEICNESGVETGPITVDLPSDFAWLSCVNGTTLDSLAPGEARTVQLLLNPSADMPLQMYQGRFVLHYGNTGLGVDFKFRAKSEVYSDLTVRAVDEWTYYTDDGPAVSGASVKVVDALTKQVVSVGTTGDDGLWSVVGLAEGYYDIYVDAEKHNNYHETIYLDDDQNLDAFLQMQTVRYEWTVTPTTIEDEYDVSIETIFETNVPAPVITVSPALVDVSDMEVGEIRQIDFTIENHGLIAVYDFAPLFGPETDYGEFVVTPLVDVLDVLSANSSVVIPVIFERRDPATADANEELVEAPVLADQTTANARGVAMNIMVFERRNVNASQTSSLNSTTTVNDDRLSPLVTSGGSPCSFLLGYAGHYECSGDRLVETSTSVVIDSICYRSGWGGGSGGVSFSGGSGPNNNSPLSPASSSTSVSVTNSCENANGDEEDDGDDDDCKPCGVEVGGSLNIKGFLLNKLLRAVNKALPTTLSILDLEPRVSFSIDGGLCCECGGLTGLGSHIEASLSGAIMVKAHWGPAKTISKEYQLSEDVYAQAYWVAKCGVDVTVELSASASYKKECGKDAEWSVSFGVNIPLSAGAEITGTSKIADLKTHNVTTTSVSGRASFDTTITVGCSGDSRSGWSLQACVQPITFTISASFDYLGASVEVHDSWTLVNGGCIPSSNSSSNQDMLRYGSEGDDEELDESLEDYFSYPADLDFSDVEFDGILDDYATAEEAAELIGYSSRTELEADLGYELNDTMSFDEFVQVSYEIYQKYHAADKGVCAKVKLQLKQNAVLTRDAFDAKLVLENATDEPISDVAVDIMIYDEWGNDVTNMFGIYPPTTENFYNADLDNLGDLEGMAAGVANWIFVPSTECAKNGPQQYSVGGILRYVAAGKEFSMTMAPASITVYPQPELELTYFWQRDVIGDDPWTDEVEPSEPFELAVLVQNKGAGDAQNLRIISAQPEIVENEKGLLIDFTIAGSKLNGQEVPNSLTVDFGTIPADGTAVGQWFMESTLQGHFIDYNATFQHVNGFNDLQFSLIKNVTIHELIHSVKDDSDGADDLPDFLVNDNETVIEVYDLPDTLYLSSGEIESVATTTNYSISGSIGWDALTVDLTASAADSGWNYVWVRDQDPGASDYELYRVVRSDGKELNSANFWQTHRTFIDGVDVKNENTLHILDKFESASDVYTYTLFYRPGDQAGPRIASIEQLQSNIRVAPLESVDIEFSEPIAESTFTTANLSLTRNGGRNLIDNLVSIQKISDTIYRISGLSAATGADGEYKLTVSTLGITDVWGNLAETGSTSLEWINASESPIVVSIDQPAECGQDAVGSLAIVFSLPVDASTFGLEDLTLTRDSGENLLTSASGAALNARSATEFVLSGLTNLTSEDGKYVLSVKATDVHGTDNKRGVGVASIEWVKDVVGPSNAVWFGVDRSAVNYGYDALYLGFDEQIDFATLSRADLTLTRNGVNVPLDARLAMGILPESLKSTDAVQEWKLVGLRNFATEDGDYVLTVDLANVADLAGNLGSGRFSVSWTVDSEAPSLAFSQGINASSSEVALAGLASEENVVVRIYDSSDSSELFAGSYSGRDVAINLALPREGARNLRVRVTDAAGNWSDSELTARIDRTAPFVLGTSIEENVLSVRFSEPTNLAELIAGGSIVRAVSVLDDVAGTALDLPAAKFVYDAATKTLEIDLNSINVAGRETIPLTLRIDGSLVLDAAGNALKGSAATAGTPIRFALSGTVATANSYSVPSLVDWNGDGKLDLLVGEKSADGLGRVQVRLNTGSNAAPSYADPFYATYRDGNATVELTVPGQGCQGAAPRAVDVDGDGALDLFVGLADGTILFYRGQGTGANWPLTAPEFVTVGLDGAKSQLSVGSRAVFEVCDWDVDGRYDLLVGAGDGKLYVLVDSASEGLFDFRNALALTSANGTGELVLSAGRAAPTLADVDGDGKLDIVAGDSNGAFWTLLNVGTPANPRFESAVRLTDVDGDLALPNSAKRSRPFATDYDGDGAADLLVGSSDGNVYLYRGLKSASFNTDGESGGEFVCSVDWSYDANVVSEQLATPNMIKSLAKPTSITVKIGSVANATDYVVQYGTDPEFATYETATTQPGYFTASGLLSSTTYYFRVKATASGYKDSNWKELSVTTDKATLKAPEFAVDTTNTAIVVKIFSIEGADRYVMEYSTDPSFESGVVHKEYASSQIGSAKTFSKLTTLTTYYVRVKATGENFYDSAWTTASPIPGAPRVAAPTLSASATKSAVIVNIRAVDGAATYELQYSQDPDFTGATVKTYQTGGAKTFTNLPFGTTYYFRVKASGDGYNDSKRSTIEFAAGELSATTLKPSNVNYGSLDLAISVVANASSYALQYATDQNFTDPKTLTYSTYGTKSLSGLDPETTYYFRAKAIGDGVNRVDSKWSVVKTTTTKAYLGQLAAPTFTATATKSAIVVKLETPVENAAKYVVEFGTDSNFATCETRSYAGVGLKTISGLQTGATYYVRVKTTAPGYADSDYAATVKLIPGGATLATPTVALAQAANTSLDLEIAEVANSTAYVVEYGTDETFATCETATFASAGVQTISGLTYGQTYFVRVKATSLAANDSKWSATLEARTTGIDAPTASVSTTKTAVVVKIGTVANASSYVVEYGTDPSYVGAGVKTYPTTGIKTISGLASGTTYYLRVKAVSTEFGESDWVELVAETKPDVQILAAPEITSVSTTKAAVTFRLNPVENATTYVVEYGTDPSFVGAGTKTYATTGAKTISGLVSGTTYFFRVKAIAEGFADSAWTTFDATTKPATTSSAVLDEEQEFFEESLATNGSELFAQSRGSANRSSGADFENYFEDDLEEFWDLLAKSAARSRNR